MTTVRTRRIVAAAMAAAYGAMAGIVVLGVVLLAGCIDESPTPVVFDQLLESTTFENRLLTPVIVYRDNVVLDTLEARTYSTYPLNRKGAVRHAWRILAPLDATMQPAGVQVREELGVQYRVNAHYRIDNEAFSGGTLFTPRIGNYTPYTLRLTVNYGTSRQFSTNYLVRPGEITSTVHAPYYYWVSDSNVLLTPTLGGRTFEIYRDDSTSLGTLELDPTYYDGSGVTKPITVY